MKIEKKSHVLTLSDLNGFVKILLSLPTDVYSDIVTASYNYPNRFEYERHRINAYLKGIFYEPKDGVFTWDNEFSFANFLEKNEIKDNSQFWFKTVYIKISDKQPFDNFYYTQKYVDALSDRFNLRFYFKDICDIRNHLIKTNDKITPGRTELEFKYSEYSFDILKYYKDSIGVSVVFAPRGILFTKTFFDTFLKNANSSIDLIEDYPRYATDKKTCMLKISTKDFDISFLPIINAVDYDLKNGKIGEKLYWENRHYMQ